MGTDYLEKALGGREGLWARIYTIVNKGRGYLLKGLLRDPARKRTVPCVKKDITYYTTQTRSEHTINISEKLVFEKVREYMKQYEYWTSIQELNKKIILDTIKKRESLHLVNIEEIDKQILSIGRRKSELLNMRLDGKISDEIYLEKINEITNDIFVLEESKKSQSKHGEISVLYEKMIELAKTLC